jgi:hypothetical protein
LRGALVIGITAAVIAAVATAALARVVPYWDFETLGALFLGFAVMGGTIWFSLRASRYRLEARAHTVELFDRAMQGLAARSADRYQAGSIYEHPMMAPIKYPGRLRGSRGPFDFDLYLSEDEDGYEAIVTVSPVSGKEGRLRPRSKDLSEEIRLRVQTLLESCDRVALERVPGAKSDASRQERPGLLVSAAGSVKLDKLLAADCLSAWIDETVALASALSAAH